MFTELDTYTSNGKRCCNKLRALIIEFADGYGRTAADAKKDLVKQIVALSNGEPEYADGGVIVPARIDYSDSIIADTVRKLNDAIEKKAYCYGILATLLDYQMIPEDEYERILRALDNLDNRRDG